MDFLWILILEPAGNDEFMENWRNACLCPRRDFGEGSKVDDFLSTVIIKHSPFDLYFLSFDGLSFYLSFLKQ